MLQESDCFYPIKGEGLSIENYFFNNKDNLNFRHYLPNFDVQRLCIIDNKDELINENETLSKINNILKIDYCMFIEMAANSWVNWHIDSPRKGPVLNLLLTPNVKSHSLFVPEVYNSTNIIECKYSPHKFMLYNTDIVHAVLTFDGPRYLFHATFEKSKKDMSWEEAKSILLANGLLE